MSSEKLLYKEGVKIPSSSVEQLENTNYTRSATRKLREKFTPKKDIYPNSNQLV